METKSRIGTVFWDLENIVPKEPRMIMDLVREQFRHVDQFFVFGNTHDIPSDILEILDRLGAMLIHVPHDIMQGDKDHADHKLYAELIRFAARYGDEANSRAVVIVSQDGDFTQAINSLRSLGFFTVVCFPEQEKARKHGGKRALEAASDTVLAVNPEWVLSDYARVKSRIRSEQVDHDVATDAEDIGTSLPIATEDAHIELDEVALGVIRDVGETVDTTMLSPIQYETIGQFLRVLKDDPSGNLTMARVTQILRTVSAEWPSPNFDKPRQVAIIAHKLGYITISSSGMDIRVHLIHERAVVLERLEQALMTLRDDGYIPSINRVGMRLKQIHPPLAFQLNTPDHPFIRIAIGAGIGELDERGHLYLAGYPIWDGWDPYVTGSPDLDTEEFKTLGRILWEGSDTAYFGGRYGLAKNLSNANFEGLAGLPMARLERLVQQAINRNWLEFIDTKTVLIRHDAIAADLGFSPS